MAVHRIFRPDWIGATLLLVLLGPGAVAQAAEVASAPPIALPVALGESAAAKPPLRLAESLSSAPQISLVAASVGAGDRLAAMAAYNAAGGRPVQNGFTRPLPTPVHLRLEAGIAAKASFRSLAGGIVAESFAGGTIWGTHVRVPQADRLRLHLTALDLPAGTRMWVWGLGEEPRGFGLELRGPDNDLWTPSTGGEDVFFELELPRDAPLPGATSGFDLPEIAQIFRLAEDGSPAPQEATTAKVGECLRDGSCFGSGNLDVIDGYRQAVAQLQYVKGGNSFLCSGGLINDKDDATFIPYLLTANHCFSTQASASTLEAYWDYRSSSCGGAAPALSLLPRSVGATLLATSAGSDFTFVRLSSIPGGRTLLGWTTAPLASGTTLYRLSHPAPGGFPLVQAFSTGSVNVTFPGCAGFSRPSFIYSMPGTGGLFGGSSGAPVLLPGGFVVGQLLGGCGPEPSNGCNPLNFIVDGAFAATYASIRQYLDPVVAGGPCVPDATTLCVDDQPGDRRFKVQVSFQTVQGGGLEGPGTAIPLSSVGVTSGGLFWFFNAGNPEMLVKVLNGCASNGRYWVFYAAGTNVGLTTVVTDTVTGASKTYTNPDRTAAPPVQDTGALPCS